MRKKQIKLWKSQHNLSESKLKKLEKECHINFSNIRLENKGKYDYGDFAVDLYIYVEILRKKIEKLEKKSIWCGDDRVSKMKTLTKGKGFDIIKVS